jgi:hypothetical protein
VQLGELAFEQDMRVAGPGYVAGAPCPGPRTLKLLGHRRQHLRVLAHAEIVVRAPHGDFRADAVIVSAREMAAAALQIGKDAVAPLRV